MAEWFKALDLKSDMSKRHHGFESHFILKFLLSFIKYVTNHFTFTIIGIF